MEAVQIVLLRLVAAHRIDVLLLDHLCYSQLGSVW